MKQTFNKGYFAIAVLLFLVEVIIALFVEDNFIRPYFGDVLVVILIYFFIQSFFQIRVLPLAIGVLAFSFLIEFLQYVNFIEILGLEKSKLASTLIGNSISWKDFIAYVAGILIVLLVENYRLNHHFFGNNNLIGSPSSKATSSK
jgi:hypothetical protein